MLNACDIYSQKSEKLTKWRSTEVDSLAIAQIMFDDQNFVMAFPFLNQLQLSHPENNRLKYLAGICCLFREDQQTHGLELLLDVYKHNKKAEDIEYYLALAYHYNNKFEEAISMADIFLKKKHLSKPQIRVGEKLIEYCRKGEKIPPLEDEGKIDDYVKLDPTAEN